MPGSAIVGEGSAYVTAEDVLQKTRSILNDAYNTPDGTPGTVPGEILTDDWAPTWEYLGIAYDMCQCELADNGVETNVKEVFLNNIPIVQNADPSVQIWISQSGTYNGSNNVASPQLPADLIVPLRLWERFQGTQNPFVQITPAQDGLPGYSLQAPQFRWYDWRADAVYLPGATMLNQIRMRYVAYYPDLTAPSSVVPYRRLRVALAWMTAYVFANSRNDPQAAQLKQNAMEQLDNIITATVRRRQRRGVARRAYGQSNGSRRTLLG